MKLFLDDVRDPPDNTWVVVRSFDQATRVILAAQGSKDGIELISFDHDLGPGKTGYDLAKWLTAHRLWPMEIDVHSANIIGRKNILDEWAFWNKHKDTESW